MHKASASDHVYTVFCSSCNHEHITTGVKFVDIEENAYGEDRLTFICPHTNEQTSAIVRRK